MTDTTTPSTPIVTIEGATATLIYRQLDSIVNGDGNVADLVRIILDASADGLITMRNSAITPIDVACPWCHAGYREPCHVAGDPSTPLTGYFHSNRERRAAELNGVPA